MNYQLSITDYQCLFTSSLYNIILIGTLALFTSSFFFHHVVQPVRDIAFGHRYPRIGGGGERAAACVGDIPVAVPASAPTHFLGVLETHASCFYKLGVELRVAADAVIHDYLGTGLDGLDSLMLTPYGENSGMS